MYEWEMFVMLWNYGSCGGIMEEEKVELGGVGGGCIVIIMGVLCINGIIEVDGGFVDVWGGGGFGGIIVIKVLNM